MTIVAFGSTFLIIGLLLATEARRHAMLRPHLEHCTVRHSRWNLHPLAIAAISLVTAIGPTMLFMSRSDAGVGPSPIGLGTAANFSVLAGQTVTNDGATTLHQSLGLSPGVESSVTGFPPGMVVPPAVIHAHDTGGTTSPQAKTDLTNAYNAAASAPGASSVPANLGGQTLVRGVYSSDSGAFEVTGALILDGANDPASVFIFQAGSTLTANVGSSIQLINGAQACNVFWQVGSSATLNASFVGTVMANESISLGTGVNVQGRVLAQTAAVTLLGNTISQPGCDLTALGDLPVTGPGSYRTVLIGGLAMLALGLVTVSVIRDRRRQGI